MMLEVRVEKLTGTSLFEDVRRKSACGNMNVQQRHCQDLREACFHCQAQSGAHDNRIQLQQQELVYVFRCVNQELTQPRDRTEPRGLQS